METVQTPASPTSAQVEPRPSPTTRVPVPFSRFHGDGVRYKAKLIGIDPVPGAEGEKMCWDSMMKMKGFEAAFRKQGKHKQRVWIKICHIGVKIIDERTGSEMYLHDKDRISSVMKDESDPRALAYVFHHQEQFFLFYFRMANLAEPVVNDIREVCQSFDEETPSEETPPQVQSSALLVLGDSSAPPPEEPVLENVFSPRPVSQDENKVSSPSSELMQVFSVQMREPIVPSLSPISEPESPIPTLSNTQILSMFPSPSVGGAPYSPPPVNMPWPLQQGIVGNQWVGQPMGGPVSPVPWPTLPSNVPVWPPTAAAAPPAGHMLYSTASGNTVNGLQALNSPPAAPNAPQNLLM